MRVRNAAVGTVVAAMAITGSAAAPALADEFTPEPWQPYRSQDFVAPAGSYCAFELSVRAVHDEEEVRVSARYADGTVRVYEYRGALISKFTNQATGESVVRDLSGRGWQTLYPDGTTTKTFSGVGPFGAGFHAGDGFPQGYYRLDGVHSIHYAKDGHRMMPVHLGSQENLCETLAYGASDNSATCCAGIGSAPRRVVVVGHSAAMTSSSALRRSQSDPRSQRRELSDTPRRPSPSRGARR